MEENEEKKKMEEKKENAKKEETTAKKAEVDSKKSEVKKETTKKDDAKQPKTEKKANTEKEGKNDDLTFKKVNPKKDDKTTTKSHGVAKAILILIMLLIAAYCIFFARNLIIVNSIASKVEEHVNSTDYSFTSIRKDKDGGGEIRIQYYEKDNIERFDYNNGNSSFIWWYDANTNEKIVATPETRKATISNVDNLDTINLPIESSLTNKTTMVYISLTSFIYSEEYNSKDCYVIDMGASQKIWIDKETGIVLKREFVDYTVESTDFNLDYQEEVYKPDLTGYEITQD